MAEDTLRELVLDVVADMNHDGEGTVTLSLDHISRLLALAGLSWAEAQRAVKAEAIRVSAVPNHH